MEPTFRIQKKEEKQISFINIICQIMSFFWLDEIYCIELLFDFFSLENQKISKKALIQKIKAEGLFLETKTGVEKIKNNTTFVWDTRDQYISILCDDTSKYKKIYEEGTCEGTE